MAFPRQAEKSKFTSYVLNSGGQGQKVLLTPCNWLLWKEVDQVLLACVNSILQQPTVMRRERCMYTSQSVAGHQQRKDER